MKGLLHVLRPVHNERVFGWGVGMTFYRFGHSREHRSLTIHAGPRDLTWEWSR